MSDLNETMKILIIGDPNVGKTNILQQYCTGEFTKEYKITVGVDFYQKNVKLNNGKTIQLHIWDTTGQEIYKAVTRQFYKGSDAAILVFDETTAETFRSLKFWIKELEQNTENKNLILGLAQNKTDLGDPDPDIKNTDIKDLLKSNNMIFQQTSAKYGDGISLLFDKIVKEHQNRKNNNNNHNASCNQNQ